MRDLWDATAGRPAGAFREGVLRTEKKRVDFCKLKAILLMNIDDGRKPMTKGVVR